MSQPLYPWSDSEFSRYLLTMFFSCLCVSWFVPPLVLVLTSPVRSCLASELSSLSCFIFLLHIYILVSLCLCWISLSLSLIPSLGSFLSWCLFSLCHTLSLSLSLSLARLSGICRTHSCIAVGKGPPAFGQSCASWQLIVVIPACMSTTLGMHVHVSTMLWDSNIASSTCAQQVHVPFVQVQRSAAASQGTVIIHA